MTYSSPSSRVTNRVLLVLVLVTIIVVAVWAINGGLDDIPVAQSDSVTVAE